MNEVNIIGRLGQDPELRYTQSGKAVVRMSIAVNDRYGQNERTYWFPVISWNGLGETVSNYLRKGSRVAVSGRLVSRSYETGDGIRRTVTEIIANSVDFLDPRPANGEAPTPEGNPSSDELYDEIPF